jgi:hypothetical protein
MAVRQAQNSSNASSVHGVTGPKSNLVASKPQYQLVPTDKLDGSGLTIQQLALIVEQDVNGQVATQANLPQGSTESLPGNGERHTRAALARARGPLPAVDVIQGSVRRGSWVRFSSSHRMAPRGSPGGV